MRTLTYGNAARTTYGYDGAGQLVRLRHSKADDTELAKFEYALNALGIPTSLVEANGDRVTWTYDSLYRLTREQRSGANGYDVSYTFDGAGNRMTKATGGATTTYTYGAADALLAENAAGARTTYSYDNAGNTTAAESAAGRTTYAWDGENRLTGIALPDGTVWSLSYDATGLRREKQTPAGATRFIWDGQRLLQETDSDGATQAHYTAGLGAYGPMLSQRRSGASAFLHTDRLGTVRLLSDASAAAIDTYLLDAFGSLIASTGSTVNPHRYVGALGYYSEPALALDYVRARWLRPSAGSWLSVDPVPSEPRYPYVRGGPTWAVDGDGATPRSAFDRMVDVMNALQHGWVDPDFGPPPPPPSEPPWDPGPGLNLDCFFEVQALMKRLEGYWKPGKGEPYTGPTDSFKHCFFGCMISQLFGGLFVGPSAYGKEFIDWLGPGACERRDIFNTNAGLACGNRDCWDCCGVLERGGVLVPPGGTIPGCRPVATPVTYGGATGKLPMYL